MTADIIPDPQCSSQDYSCYYPRPLMFQSWRQLTLPQTKIFKSWQQLTLFMTTNFPVMTTADITIDNKCSSHDNSWHYPRPPMYQSWWQLTLPRPPMFKSWRQLILPNTTNVPVMTTVLITPAQCYIPRGCILWTSNCIFQQKIWKPPIFAFEVLK